MITIKEISQKRNIPVETLYRRLKRFNIEPRTKKGITNYYNNNVDVLIGQKPPRFFPTQLKKIKIIEYYLMFQTQPKKVTADELGIEYEYFLKVLKEWKENDNCITIKSRL